MNLVYSCTDIGRLVAKYLIEFVKVGLSGTLTLRWSLAWGCLLGGTLWNNTWRRKGRRIRNKHKEKMCDAAQQQPQTTLHGHLG